ncbi:SAM-dependent methyltransferase [Ottowia caeni]|uniref:SAM-dependent methyltransferase n=1 Tax=Ottowia caeni TaxID=2870339 RepID=UPI001E379258|nr:SAM-dependent methyltransferase [Ottowia caeni]
MIKGKLYLVPSPLDHGCEDLTPLDGVLPQETMTQASNLVHWISENAKSTRAFLKRVDAFAPLAHPLQTLQITELPREVHKKGDHAGTRSPQFDPRPLLKPALDGLNIGLISEAGMPGVADPGSSVVRAAHELEIEVVPLIGPVSILLALAASGLNGQNFAFMGYLPQDPTARVQRIRELEAFARKTGQTQLFIETPYRNRALLQALLETLREDIRLTMACGLTLQNGTIRTRTASQWKRGEAAATATAELLKLPCVFAIGL